MKKSKLKFVFTLCCLFGLVFAWGCGDKGGGSGTTSKQTIFPTTHQALVIAHRGASGYAPENTMSAFILAANLGADMLEADVEMTKDNRLVIMHDEWVNRTTNDSGLVSSLTLEEVLNLDAGSWFSDDFRGEKIPQMEDVLALAKERNLYLDVDLKASHEVAAVVQLVRQYGWQDKTLYSSFYRELLDEVRDIAPEAHTALALLETVTLNSLLSFRDFDFVNLPWNNWVETHATLLRERGIPILIYTLNDEEEILAAGRVGVDGIITDYPDRAIQAMEK